MITTVVFDLDDTLYDEIEYCKSGFNAVAGFLAGKFDNFTSGKIYDNLWQQLESGNQTTIFNATLENLGIEYNQEFIEKLVQIYREHLPKLTLPQETKNVLEQLKDRYTLAMLTDGFMPAQENKVKALQIEKYFKCIIYTELLGRQFWKPSPAGFEKLMQQLNVKAENCVYVADNVQKDFIAPNQLGFLTVQLLRPQNVHKGKSSDKIAIPQKIINKLSDLPVLLEGIR